MTPELQAFIDHFEDEEHLRSAIEGLLSKQGEFRGVRNLHGKDECGKDLVFYAPAGLGGLKLNACVVKLSKISGSASDSASGARNVLIQCNQALDTPITNTRGEREWVSYVYVMCPNELSATVMQSISGLFEGRASQIEFKCGHDFLEMFRRLWPDFIFFQPDLLSAHLESISKELECDHNIQRLATAHGLSTLTQARNIYVEPLLSQLQGKLCRGVPLIKTSEITAHLAESDIDVLGNLIDKLATSLQVVYFLPPTYQKNCGRAQENLRFWQDRLKREWQSAFTRAANEAFKRNERPPGVAQIPQRVTTEFQDSDGYRFLLKAYSGLDQEITEANGSLESGADRLQLLASAAFARYCCLLHATTVCFPTVEFKSEGMLEWSPEEVLAYNANIMVTGAPGFGKTSFCRNHFLADLEKFKSGGSRVLPLYFASHTIAVENGQSFQDIFIRREVAAKLDADPSLIVRIYLDGLDEIRSDELRDRVLAIAKETCTTQNSRYHCVATARDHVGGYSTSWLVRVGLSPLTEDQVRELVTAWLDGNADLISRFYLELGRSPSLIPMLGVPLLATLTVLVFKNLHRLPENRLRLYQMFIDLLLGGWDLAKGLQRSPIYSSTVKMLILTRLAGIMHAQREKECTDSSLISALKEVAPTLATKSENVIGELVEDGLLVPTGKLSYTFPHLSLQEYLAAKDAIDPSRQEEKRIVRAYLAGEDWYKEVAIFIVSMTTNPLRMRGWIVELAKPFAKPSSLSDSEKRAGYLISKLSEAFPECRTSPAAAGNG